MKIKGLLAVAALVSVFVCPAKAVTVNYDITFDFTNAGLTDVVGHLAINSPPASFPGTYSGAGLANVISSFSVTFQNPTDTFSCAGNGCIYGPPVPGGFTSLSFNAAGALTAVRHLKVSNVERELHRDRVAKVRSRLEKLGIPYMPNPSHIVPVMVGDAAKCKWISDILLDSYGVYVQPINYPTVPRKTERLRITPSPLHTDADIDHLIHALSDLWSQCALARAVA